MADYYRFSLPDGTLPGTCVDLGNNQLHAALDHGGVASDITANVPPASLKMNMSGLERGSRFFEAQTGRFRSTAATPQRAVTEWLAAREMVEPTATLEFDRPALAAGSRYPLIWRPGAPDPEGAAFTRTSRAAEVLLLDAEDLLLMVEADPANDNAFGLRLRELLIMACTDVEASWRGVLSANGYPGDRWTTNDYVKLLKPMRLERWRIRWVRFPAYPPITPFEHWDPAKPTTSLDWYDAYNAVKHDRHGSLPRANLRMTLRALAASLVMVAAQYHGGPERGLDGLLDGEPVWPPSEHYVPPGLPQAPKAWTDAQLKL